MSAKTPMLTGLTTALVIAGLGGGGVRVLAAKVSLPEPPGVSVARAKQRIEARVVAGDVQAMTVDGTWRGLTQGSALERPAGVAAFGQAAAELVYGSTAVTVSRGATVHFNAPGRPLRLYLESGRVAVRKLGASIVTTVPGASLTIEGQHYGVFVRGDRTTIAVRDGELVVTLRGEQTTYAKGREVNITSTGATYGVFPPRLSVAIQSSREVADGYAVVGKTAPHAEVVVRRGDTFETVPVSLSGVFETRIAAASPEPGELIAFDAAGRHAEVGKPSASSGELVKSIGEASKREAVEVKAKAPAPAPKPAATKVAPKRAAPAVKPKKALKPPTAKPAGAAPALEKKELEVKLPSVSPPPEIETKKSPEARPADANRAEENIELEWD